MYIIMFSFLSKVQTRSESWFTAFTTLIQVLPSVGKAIEDPTTDIDVYLMQVSIVGLVSHQFVVLGLTLFSCKKVPMMLAVMTFEESKKNSRCGSI